MSDPCFEGESVTMDDNEQVNEELARAHELQVIKLIGKTIVLALAILVGCPSVMCMHQDWQRGQHNKVEWSTYRP
jgi:hypothetical protein